MNNETPALPPVKIAFVIDGTVVDVLHTDDRLGAIFLSNPEVIDVTGPDGEPVVGIGWMRNASGDFIPASPAEPE